MRIKCEPARAEARHDAQGAARGPRAGLLVACDPLRFERYGADI